MNLTRGKAEGKRRLAWLLGFVAGCLNGLFGAGGGMVAVPLLRGMGLSGGRSHATSMAVIFPLTVASGILYLQAGQFSLGDALPYLPGGVVGAVTGALLLPRIKTVWLRRLFGVVILFSAGRLLLK